MLFKLVDNPVNALLEGNFLGCLTWAVLLGISFRRAPTSFREHLETLAGGVADVVRYVIRLAPVGIFGLVAYTVATTGVAPHSYEPMSGERCVAPSKTRTKPCSLSDVAQPSANDVKLSVSPTADDDAWIRNEHSVVRTASSGTTEIAPSGASKMASPEQVAAVGEMEQARTRTESAARRRPRVRRRREPSVMLHGEQEVCTSSPRCARRFDHRVRGAWPWCRCAS